MLYLHFTLFKIQLRFLTLILRLSELYKVSWHFRLRSFVNYCQRQNLTFAPDCTSSSPNTVHLVTAIDDMCLVQTLESRNNKRLVRHIRHTEVFLQVYGCIFPRTVCRKHLSFIRAVRNKRDFRLLNNESLCSGRVGLRLSDCPSLDCNAALRLL